jgi:hypothetical protein
VWEERRKKARLKPHRIGVALVAGSWSDVTRSGNLGERVQMGLKKSSENGGRDSSIGTFRFSALELVLAASLLQTQFTIALPR